MDWVVNNKDASSSHRNQSDYHANLHFNPQLKYDLGKSLGYEAKHLYVGIEYDYWSDKYGIKDSQYFTTDQNTVSALVKYHF
jgi:nucleoside-specific outer membrane channel protein Tsx